MLDGLERHELRVLSTVASIADSLTPSAEFLLGIPRLTAHLSGDLQAHLTRMLVNLTLSDQGRLEQVIAQPWFTDGLTEEEAVLVVTLEGAARDSPDLFQDLLAARFIQTRTAELSIGGRVRLWVVQNTPFPAGEQLFQRLEEAARYWEGFMQEPIPTNDVILLVVDPRGKSYGLSREGHLGTHMRLVRSVDLGTVSYIPHEVGHYFFREPRWLAEGVSQFGEAHVRHLSGVQTLEQRKQELSLATNCSGYANIRHFQYESPDEGSVTFDRCPYDLGENFMLSLVSLVGQQAVSAALRDLYVSDRDGRLPITEEAVYNAFLANAPADRQAAFSDLYRRLHGAAFAFPETDFDDAHGGDPANAGTTEVGRSVTGVLGLHVRLRLLSLPGPGGPEVSHHGGPSIAARRLDNHLRSRRCDTGDARAEIQ